MVPLLVVRYRICHPFVTVCHLFHNIFLPIHPYLSPIVATLSTPCPCLLPFLLPFCYVTFSPQFCCQNVHTCALLSLFYRWFCCSFAHDMIVLFTVLLMVLLVIYVYIVAILRTSDLQSRGCRFDCCSYVAGFVILLLPLCHRFSS